MSGLRLQDRVLDIVDALERDGLIGKRTPGVKDGKIRFGTNGSLRVTIDGPQRGDWRDHELKHGGRDPLSLIETKGGFDIRQANDWIRAKLGLVWSRTEGGYVRVGDAANGRASKGNGHPAGANKTSTSNAGKANGGDAGASRGKGNGRSGGRGSILATYDYHNETGEMLFQVVRYPNHEFRQLRPDGKGGWIWNRGDIPPVPYHLPDIIQLRASRNGHAPRIIIAEGEKDADRLIRDWGVRATTNPGGAGNWHDSFDQYFAGLDVVILSDNDAVGRDHAAKVANHLVKVAGRVRVVYFDHLEEKQDISDWLDQGGSQSDFETILEDIPPFEPTKHPVEQPSGQDPSRGKPKEELWPEMAPEAYYGLAGDVVRAIEPHTEADPVALLLNFLIMVGNMFGREPHARVGAQRHGLNNYAVLVGPTSKGRKGTSAAETRRIMGAADSDWVNHQIETGLSTGEGIIWRLHDEIIARERVKNGKTVEYKSVVKEANVQDKRLLVIEPEFSGTLEVMKRDGSTLSRVLRDAWDGQILATLTKNSPTKATGTHISTIGHITLYELRGTLERTSLFNGFANRFLFVCVRLSKQLPFGGNFKDSDVIPLAARMRQALDHAKSVFRSHAIAFDKEAAEIWDVEYRTTLSVDHLGLFGAVVARAEAHVLRLATLYTVLAGFYEIGPKQLRAALAVWRYCEASARYIWGDALGDPFADEIEKPYSKPATQG